MSCGRGGSPLQNVAGGLHVSVFARFISLWKADHALRVAESSDLSPKVKKFTRLAIVCWWKNWIHFKIKTI